ncbi:hypothetical protein LXL04_031285 [Taraxacum kok-saghyz]
MDPFPFVRLVVGNLSLKFSGSTGAGNHPPSSCYCKIKLKNFASQIGDVAYCTESDVIQANDQIKACFNFNKPEFDKLVEKCNGLKIEVYSSRKGTPICGVGSSKLIGVVTVGLDSKVVDGDSSNWGGAVVQNGWKLQEIGSVTFETG